MSNSNSTRVAVKRLSTPTVTTVTHIWRDELSLVDRASRRRSTLRAGSPWTAMLFRSCRIVFPADTCTVTVLMPSRENVHATLPSRVITGCWGRKKRTDEKGEKESERLGVWVMCWPHTAVIHTAEVWAHTRTFTHARAYVVSSPVICATRSARGPQSSPCDALSLLTSPFVPQIAIWC